MNFWFPTSGALLGSEGEMSFDPVSAKWVDSLRQGLTSFFIMRPSTGWGCDRMYGLD